MIKKKDCLRGKKVLKRLKKQQNIGSIPLIVSNYLKSLSQEAKDLMDEIEDADNDIDYNKLLFIGSNKEKFNFNIFSTPLNLLLDIFNSKITLTKAEINQKDLNEKIEELKYNYKPKNNKEKEEINDVLIHSNDMLDYGHKIIEAFINGTFSSEHLKKSDDAANDYTLKGVNNFIQKIELMAKKINYHHQLVMQKSLLIPKIQMKTKKL